MKLAKIALISIQLLVMLNAFGGGYYGLSGATASTPRGSTARPFSSYFIPSLFLFTVIGGGMASRRSPGCSRAASPPGSPSAWA